VYISLVQTLAFPVSLLLFLLSYYVLLQSEFGQQPSLFAFGYMIVPFAFSVLSAWSIVKFYRAREKKKSCGRCVH